MTCALREYLGTLSAPSITLQALWGLWLAWLGSALACHFHVLRRVPMNETFVDQMSALFPIETGARGFTQSSGA